VSEVSKHPESEAMALEETELLMTIVRQLPSDRQQLLILKFVERMSNAEIGDVMGRSEGAVKSLYHRTLNALRAEAKRLEEESSASKSLKDEKVG
jgi:RNA polymerase sigma-70 factor (ECF subfamily)